MDIVNFIFLFFVFLILFIFLKKNILLLDNINYSNHKIIGAENKTPIMIGGIYLLLIHLIFNFKFSPFLTISAILPFY